MQSIKQVVRSARASISKAPTRNYELKDFVVTLTAKADFQLKQMMDILRLKLSKRGIDVCA